MGKLMVIIDNDEDIANIEKCATAQKLIPVEMVRIAVHEWLNEVL